MLIFQTGNSITTFFQNHQPNLPLIYISIKFYNLHHQNLSNASLNYFIIVVPKAISVFIFSINHISSDHICACFFLLSI